MPLRGAGADLVDSRHISSQKCEGDCKDAVRPCERAVTNYHKLADAFDSRHVGRLSRRLCCACFLSRRGEERQTGRQTKGQTDRLTD